MKYEQAGTYTIEYKAVDECGNETVRERTVTVNALVTYHTTLFKDGTLIINESSKNRDANITSHGAVVKEYVPLDASNGYNFTSGSQRPWNSEIGKIKKVEFGSSIKPVSINFWFQAAGNLASIDWTNFNGADVTTARAFVASTKITSFSLPSMPKLETIRYICNQCASLTSVDMSKTGATNIKNMTDAFQGCYALTTVDISGLAGTVETCDRTFANMSDGADMAIETIYAKSALDFTGATSSTSMFRACTSLVGGNGTTFDSSKTSATMAHIDTAENPGYFTAK